MNATTRLCLEFEELLGKERATLPGMRGRVLALLGAARNEALEEAAQCAYHLVERHER